MVISRNIPKLMVGALQLLYSWNIIEPVSSTSGYNHGNTLYFIMYTLGLQYVTALYIAYGVMFTVYLKMCIHILRFAVCCRGFIQINFPISSRHLTGTRAIILHLWHQWTYT